MAHKRIAIDIGARYERLVVQRVFTDGGYTRCECLCDCGQTVTAKAVQLARGLSKSCGCYRKDHIAAVGRNNFKRDATGARIPSEMLRADTLRRYRAKHQKACRDRSRAWNKTASGRAIRSEWATGNREYALSYGRKLRREVLAGYGGACACCGESRWQFLAIDHVHGGGGKERKTGLKGSKLLCMLRAKNYPPEYRLLCHNCNMARGIYGACPHEAERATDAVA